MSRIFHQAQLQDLLKEGEGSLPLRDKARIRSAAGPGAGNWLEARPVTQAMTMSNPAIGTAFRWRFGLPLSHDPSLRCLCGQPVDALGDHFQLCNLGGHRQFRHDGCRRIVASLCRLVGTVQEERHMHTIGTVPPEMANHRIDIVMDDGYNRSPTLYNMADVTFTHPVSTNQAKLTRYSRIDGAAAQEAVARKMRKYDQVARAMGISFSPLAVETFGRWSSKALWYIRDKAASCALTWDGKVNQRQKALILQRWWRSISCVCQKMNSLLLNQKLALAKSFSSQSGTPPGLVNTYIWD